MNKYKKWLREYIKRGEHALSNEMAEEILDYITNLQNENEELKREKAIINLPVYHGDAYISHEMEYQARKEVEIRNEKAIEYIENAQERDESCEACSLYIPDLLNILEGGDE